MSKTELLMDKDLRSVLEFMQENVDSSKLFAIADALPGISRLLWGDVQQEPIKAINLRACLDLLQPTASESCLAGKCVDGGFAAAVVASPHL